MYRLTPLLHLVSRERQPKVTRILLEQGADSDAQDNDSQLGHLEVACVLLKYGDVNSGDINNWTLLHEAS
jgi:ankyrin repeat protein